MLNFATENNIKNDLNDDELKRYARHLSLNNFGLEGQKKLKNTSVFIIGAGGIGSPLILYLAAMGIGKIGIIDGDCVDLSNLQRQVLFENCHIGEKKAHLAKAKINAINPNINVDIYDQFLEINQDHSFLESYDVIIDGSDNFKTRFLANGLSLKYKIPLISASVLDFSYQVGIFNLDNHAPCFNCLYPKPPEKGLIPSCSEAGVLGIIPGQASLLALNLFMHYLMGKIKQSVLYLFDGEKIKLNQFKLEKEPLCPYCESFSWDDFKTKFMVLFNDENKKNNDKEKMKLEIEKDEANHLLETEHAVLIDIRNPWEREIRKINPSEFIPNAMPEDLKPWIDQKIPVILYCEKGVRTYHLAYHVYQVFGEVDVYSLKGGISEV